MPIRGCEWERKSSAGGGEREEGEEKGTEGRKENRKTKREAGRERKETERLADEAAGERRRRREKQREMEKSGSFATTALVMKSRSLMFLCSEANEALSPPQPTARPRGWRFKVNAVVCQE